MIRVLIVDDQVVVTQGLRVILNAAPTIEVVGTAYEGSQAVEMAGKLTPDLFLMDLKMPGMNGIHATRAIRGCCSRYQKPCFTPHFPSALL